MLRVSHHVCPKIKILMPVSSSAIKQFWIFVTVGNIIESCSASSHVTDDVSSQVTSQLKKLSPKYHANSSLSRKSCFDRWSGVNCFSTNWTDNFQHPKQCLTISNIIEKLQGAQWKLIHLEPTICKNFVLKVHCGTKCKSRWTKPLNKSSRIACKSVRM